MVKNLKNILLSLIFLFLATSEVAATEVIHSFAVQINAGGDGKMTVTEEINYDFGEEGRHGIFRFIPTVSQVGDLYRVIQIRGLAVKRDGQKEKFSQSSANKQLYLKIGDPDKTITGAHTYEIKYEVENGIGSNFTDHDEIYWNVTGNEWEVPIEKATGTIEAPAASTASTCFTGVLGSRESHCSISGNNIFQATALNPYEGFSVVTSYPVGTFPKRTLQKNAPGSYEEFISNPIVLVTLFGIPILLNFILAPLAWRWYQRNRDKKKYGPPVVNFDFPEGPDGQRMPPLEAGIMDTTAIDKEDVLATIYDLAIRKYIKIEEVKKEKKLFGLDVGDQKETTIKKLKDYADLNSFEKTLLGRLFESGEEVEVSSLKTDFYKTYEQMEKDAFSELVKGGFYTKNPKNQKALLFVASIFSLFFLTPILSVVLFYLSFKMNGRTPLGDLTDWKIDGLKLFLKGRGREYNWNAKNLHVVEQMIPYAVSLGYIDQFIKEFQIHYPDYQPTWYGGYAGSNFHFANAAFMASFSSNITTSAPSSSSGFSGGGSSGGGGGGGGGGSW